MIPFALALHRALTTDPHDNLCWSPYAVARALEQVAVRARGRTRDELVAALLGEEGGDLAELVATLTMASELTAPRNAARPELAVSTTLWADPTVDAHARRAPFLADPDKARALINSDVAATTHGLIPELIDTLPSGVVSALVVALYLRCGWVEEFEEKDTAPRRFRTPAGKKHVPTMRVVAEFGYARTEDWQVVTVPATVGSRR